MAVAMAVTSGQSNLTKTRIAAAHGRFSRILHVHPYLIYASKLLGPTRFHNPNGISIGSFFCRAYDRER